MSPRVVSEEEHGEEMKGGINNILIMKFAQTGNVRKTEGREKTHKPRMKRRKNKEKLKVVTY